MKKRTVNTYQTGTGQVLRGVHAAGACKGHQCVIHRPSAHHMVSWPTHWREDRKMMERICPHGVGHPDPDDIAYTNDSGIHGCDGCCRTPEEKEKTR